MRNIQVKLITPLLLTLLFTANSFATMLDGIMTVDNSFTAYLSTNDSVAGTPIGNGASWPSEDVVSGMLTPNVTNFLHIQATDVGAPAMFIGEFSLSDMGFSFAANGLQTLLTNINDWQVSVTGFGSNYMTPADRGPDGTGPWGNFANIDDAARFIWEPQLCGSCTVYFSTAIRPNQIITTVPEPTSLALLGLGLAGLGFRRKAA